jgi:hypothetical protein
MATPQGSILSRMYVCPDCGNDVAFRSRPRTTSEQYILPFLLLRPVRCSNCFRRDYRPIFIPARERLEPVPTRRPVESAEPLRRNVA